MAYKVIEFKKHSRCDYDHHGVINTQTGKLEPIKRILFLRDDGSKVLRTVFVGGYSQAVARAAFLNGTSF